MNNPHNPATCQFCLTPDAPNGADDFRDFGAGGELATHAGRDPDEIIAKFVMTDFATVVNGLDLTLDEKVKLIQNIDLEELGDLICEVSHWSEAFEDFIAANRWG